jgi:hypothetical protein
MPPHATISRTQDTRKRQAAATMLKRDRSICLSMTALFLGSLSAPCALGQGAYDEVEKAVLNHGAIALCSCSKHWVLFEFWGLMS